MSKTTMTDAAKEARRKYDREWRKNHPEAVRRYRIRYWERKAEAAEAEDDQDDQEVDEE